jgi:NAD-dependent deacetylase sirtuin 2
VKPDIVFFGENLPVRFGKLAKVDFNRENCDLLIVMGTSLQVQPFAGLIEYPDIDCPRILINREKVGEVPSRRGFFERGTSKGRGFDFSEEGKRDVLFLGDCDEGVRQLCEHLEWELE